MATFTVRPEGIIRQPAMTMPGNATGSEAACTSLTASQIRTLLSLGTADSPSFSGMTLSGHLLFNATNTYDVGNGTYDPRTVRAATSVLSPLFNNPAAATTTLGNATYGVTVPGQITAPTMIIDNSNGWNQGLVVRPWVDVRGNTNVSGGLIGTGASLLTSGATATSDLGIRAAGKIGFGTNASVTPALVLGTDNAATFSGDISMSKTSAQGYITAWNQAGTYSSRLYHGTFGAYLETDNSNVNLAPANGIATVFRPGVDSSFIIYGLASSKNMTLTAAIGAIGMTDSWSIGSASKITTYLSGGVGPTLDLWLSANSGLVNVYNSNATNNTLGVWSSNGKHTDITHDGTNGILSTSSGNLNLVPTGGTVAVTGNISSSNSSLTVPSLVHNTNWGYGYYTGNLLLFTAGTIAAAITASECRFSKDHSIAWSSASNNLSGADTSLSRMSAGVVKSNGGLVASAGSISSSSAPQNTAVGVCDLGSAAGMGPAVVWSELGVANWGTLGFAAGSSTLSYRTGGTSMTTGTEVFTITSAGSLTHTGGQQTGYVAKTANYTTTADDHLVNVTANSIDITLETAVGCAGRIHEIINTGSGTVTMKTTSAQTISGSASGALTLAQWKSMTVKSNGANWLIISQIT